MDRPSIQRSDFPTVRRGYEPDAVDAHLRHVADEMEAIRSRGPVAAAASAQVQKILEAAESTAEQLRSDAGEEAREHVHRVSTAARELLERLGAMHDELGALMDRLSAELRSLERDVVEIAPPPEEEPLPDEPEPVAEEPEPVAEEPEPLVEEPEPAPAEPAAAPETAAGKARSRRGRSKAKTEPEPQAKPADDEEAARLVALDMALAGTPRDETERYLAEHYTLADPGAVLDDVYALAGS
jgi:DivIVA domain-containing protein